MTTVKPFLILCCVLFVTLMANSSGYPQFREGTDPEKRLSPEMAIIEISNVRYLLPKGTKFRKRAGVITFEGAGEYTARRLYDMEEQLQESEQELKRLERELRHRRTLHPHADGEKRLGRQ